jgi:hypothetical protein
MLTSFLAIEIYPHFTKEWWFVTAGAIATVGLYSILNRENRFYRLIEHIFLGLGAGVIIGLTWTEELREVWWRPFFEEGHYLWAIPVPIAILGYTVFSQKHGWLSRIPIGLLLGLWAGQQFKSWTNRWLPQVHDTMKPLWPDQWTLQPEVASPDVVYASTAVNNLVIVLTTLAVLTYFFFSFEQKWSFVRNTATLGRWLLMVAFGAIFGATIMNRFILMIDRMFFLIVEWLQPRWLVK